MNTKLQDKLDMSAFGRAVKQARESRGWSRDKLAEALDLSTRYVMYIETRGQHPSLQVLYEIARVFDISVDQFFFPHKNSGKTTLRRQLDAMLDTMSDKELLVMAGTAQAIQESNQQ